MKKKCTNSKCRRVFRVPYRRRVICPYCGKVYPRLIIGLSKEQIKIFKTLQDGDLARYKLEVTDCVREGKVQTTKMIRRITGRPVDEIITAVKNISDSPIVIRENLSLIDAIAEKDAIDRKMNKNKKHICQVDIVKMYNMW